MVFLKQNDEGAFSALYQRHWQRPFYTAQKRLNDAEDAKKIVKEIFYNL